MQAQGDTKEPGEADPEPIRRGRGWRLWVLRSFIIALLVAGAGTVAFAAVTIVTAAKEPVSRKPQYGVLMPDDTAYRQTVNALLRRKHAERLRGVRVQGRAGKVTVVHRLAGRPSFVSSYLNPDALSVVARSIGLRSDSQITVSEMRLEVVKATGRLRWRVRGEQRGRLWRAVVAPNGTGYRRIATNKQT